MTTTLRALSLWRPWPWLILHAGKDVENRGWGTGYRGPLVLHAGRTLQHEVLHDLDLPNAGDIVAQGYVGIVTITNVHHAVTCGGCSTWADPDSWHWVLSDPRPFPAPIAGPGRQRLFTPPPDAVTTARALIHPIGKDA